MRVLFQQGLKNRCVTLSSNNTNKCSNILPEIIVNKRKGEELNLHKNSYPQRLGATLLLEVEEESSVLSKANTLTVNNCISVYTQRRLNGRRCFLLRSIERLASPLNKLLSNICNVLSMHQALSQLVVVYFLDIYHHHDWLLCHTAHTNMKFVNSL